MVSGVGASSSDILAWYLQQATQPTPTAATTALSGATAPAGGTSIATLGETNQDSVQISGPGKLLGELQQLQSQDPTKAQQVLSDIASQLTAASQQATGQQSTFLSNLASRFETAATTGNLSSLQPHHHHHGGQGVYNQLGQVTPTSGTDLTGGTGGTSSAGGLNLQQLFASISGEVSQALGS